MHRPVTASAPRLPSQPVLSCPTHIAKGYITAARCSGEVSIAFWMQGVPKFMLFRNMQLLEEFSTREQDHLIEAVRRHADIEHLLE